MQKFQKGDLVRISKDLGPYMAHFKNDCDAIVIGSYKDLYGGKDEKNYQLHLKGNGIVAWYWESQLTLIEKNRLDLLEKWQIEEEEEHKIKFDLDWIFNHGKEVLKAPHSSSIAALAKCFGLVDLWGKRGEGTTYYANAIGTLMVAKSFLENNDKDGWLKKANEMAESPTVRQYIL